MLAEQMTEEKVLFPQKVLIPGEKLLIPLEICFRYNKEEIEWLKKEDRNEPPIELRNIENTQYISSVEAINTKMEKTLYKIKTSSFLSLLSKPKQSQTIEKEFLFGPSISIDKIEIDDKSYPFRQYEAGNFVMHSGNEKGSCPFVYTYSLEHKNWISEGHILYGMSSKHKEGIDEIKLKRFTGKILIKENESEVSFLDLVYIKVKESDGNEYIISPDNKALCAEDGAYLTLKKGEQTVVLFKMPQKSIKGELYLRAKGYYITY